jgi:hypothetical protein
MQASYGNQALILQAWGRLDDAMALHRRREIICLELGNRASLTNCYSNCGLLAREAVKPTSMLNSAMLTC